MKWTSPNPLLQGMQTHPDFPRKYKLEKQSHRSALLHNTKGLQALIERDYKAAWALIDALVADVLASSADVAHSNSDSIKLWLHIGGAEQKSMEAQTAGLEALWTLPLRMDARMFKQRPVLRMVNNQLSSWLRGYRLGKLHGVEYGPLLAVAWMEPMQRQELLRTMVIKEAQKDEEIRDPGKIMGAQYLLGFPDSDWDSHAYLAASHGIQRWFERLFFQGSPHGCDWIASRNALIGEWFPEYWRAAKGHQEHECIRRNTLAGLQAMTFPVDEWYSWWSWHALVSAPMGRGSGQWSIATPIVPGQPGIYRSVRQPLSRPSSNAPIDADIIDCMQTKHPKMAQAYGRWSQLAAATLDPMAGDVKWVQRMWDMHNASLQGSTEESFSLDGLVLSG